MRDKSPLISPFNGTECDFFRALNSSKWISIQENHIFWIFIIQILPEVPKYGPWHGNYCKQYEQKLDLDWTFLS